MLLLCHGKLCVVVGVVMVVAMQHQHVESVWCCCQLCTDLYLCLSG
jgi:hypothetical protein